MFVDIECVGVSYIRGRCEMSLKHSHEDCFGVDEREGVGAGVG